VPSNVATARVLSGRRPGPDQPACLKDAQLNDHLVHWTHTLSQQISRSQMISRDAKSLALALRPNVLALALGLSGLDIGLLALALAYWP